MRRLQQKNDPLAVIAETPPAFSPEAAVAVLRERYGLTAAVSALVSERDQNFRVRAENGKQFVLKIANAAEAAEVTDFQVQALLHVAAAIERDAIPITTPKIVPTIDGESQFMMESIAGRHIARLVTFVSGDPLAERIASAGLARNMGAYLAHLGHALAGFAHAGSGQSLLWDMQQALSLRPLVTHIRGAELASAVSSALDEFATYVEPVLGSLRTQVIHSDFNPDNVLTVAGNADKVAGVIDFGDMLRAPLIIDVGIGASYLRPPDGDPLRLVAEFVAGYHSVEPLELSEIDILFELIQARLCASIAILDWRATVRGSDDPYLEKLIRGEASAGRFLCRLRAVPRTNARQVFRQVCASTPAVRRQRMD
jgi:Ser/Thr protein kinase RdoA (MazF antagonist)